jgi:hypothetical protein
LGSEIVIVTDENRMVESKTGCRTAERPIKPNTTGKAAKVSRDAENEEGQVAKGGWS